MRVHVANNDFIFAQELFRQTHSLILPDREETFWEFPLPTILLVWSSREETHEHPGHYSSGLRRTYRCHCRPPPLRDRAFGPQPSRPPLGLYLRDIPVGSHAWNAGHQAVWVLLFMGGVLGTAQGIAVIAMAFMHTSGSTSTSLIFLVMGALTVGVLGWNARAGATQVALATIEEDQSSADEA